MKEKYNFDEKASVDDKFEHQIVMDILNNVPYDQIKTVELYVEPTVQGAQTIDDKIKQENEEFLQTPAEFNKIDMAATAQKKPKSGFYNDLFDAIIDLTDSRQMIDDAPATINFVDYRLFSENAIEDHVKQIITIF